MSTNDVTQQRLVVVGAALMALLVFISFDTPDLALVLVTIIGYFLRSKVSGVMDVGSKKIRAKNKTMDLAKVSSDGKQKVAAKITQEPPDHNVRLSRLSAPRPISGPVPVPRFRSSDLVVGVRELLEHISPTEEGDQLVRQLVSVARRTICELIPNAKVRAVCTGNPLCRRAFAIPEPQVDLVVNLSQVDLVDMGQVMGWAGVNENRKLRQWVTIACKDRLVARAGFKFVRCAFRGDHPKISITGCANHGGGRRHIAMDLSVNSPKPFHNAALVAEYSGYDPVIWDLLLIVQRWAHDRVLSHVAKGHLRPYAWTILTIFFMQVYSRHKGGTPLPAYQSHSNVLHSSDSMLQPQKSTPDAAFLATELFKEMIKFYDGFDWKAEGISIRCGHRAPPQVGMLIHVVICADGSVQVGPSIEDPFEPSKNLGNVITASGLARLKVELARAHALCARGCSISELLDPEAVVQKGLQEVLMSPDEEDGDGKDDDN